MKRPILAPLLLLPSLAAVVAAQSAAAEPAPRKSAASSSAVTARLAAPTTELVPGQTARLAVVLDVPAGWHIYAPCINDSGLPVDIQPRPPEGWTVRASEWPAPTRHLSEGELLDHVYEGRVVLPFEVDVPASAAGSRARIEAHVDWMACKTACVLGEADVSLELAVLAAGKPPAASPEAALFKDALARTPRPLPTQGAPLTAALEGGALVLAAPGAAGMSFLPDAECAMPADLLHEGAADGARLVVRLEPGASGAVRGVVELRWPAGRANDVFRIERPLAAAQSDSGLAPRAPSPQETDHDR